MDDAFPTMTRYLGVALTLVLVAFSLAGFYVQAAPGFIAAAGMILYKTVQGASAEPDEPDEKWSHLP
jgi:hypothetical protein